MLALNDLIGAQVLTAGQPDQARQLYQVWLAMNAAHPLSFIAYFNCSTLQAQLGDPIAAEASLQAALKAKPDFAPAHINLGSAMERRGPARKPSINGRPGSSGLRPSMAMDRVQNHAAEADQPRDER